MENKFGNCDYCGKPLEDNAVAYQEIIKSEYSTNNQNVRTSTKLNTNIRVVKLLHFACWFQNEDAIRAGYGINSSKVPG